MKLSAVAQLNTKFNLQNTRGLQVTKMISNLFTINLLNDYPELQERV